MKAILEFNTSDPDDNIALDQARAATDALGHLWMITQHLRSRLKYGELPELVAKELEDLKQKMINDGVYELLERVWR